MSLLGNLLWFLCGGAISGFCWLAAGMLWCLSVVGIPIGMQCFKFARLSFMPFGKEIVYGGGAVKFLVNIAWLLLSGLELALVNCVLGVILCCTVVGIPFGRQFFKIAKLALAPFGAGVEG